MQLKKNKVKIFFIIFFLALGVLLPFVISSCINNSGGYYSNTSMMAKEYVMDAVIDEKGDMHVVEKIVIDNYTDMYNNYFYKEIAYNKNNTFGISSTNRSYLKEDVRVIVEDYTGVVFDTDSSLNNWPTHFVGFSYEGDRDERGYSIKCESTNVQCDMVFYYNKPGMATITTFTYEYTIEGVITQYNDISEFNWVMLDYQPFEFNDITINITLPEGEYNIADEKTFFHGTNMAKREFVDDNKIVITADDMVSNEQIEVRLLLDNSLFGSVRDINKVDIDAKADILAYEKEQTKNADIKHFIGNVGAVVVYAVGALVIIGMGIVCYKKYDKEYKSDFYNEYYRELPADYSPAVMGYLYKFREIDDDDLSATLLDLIRRKYLILETGAGSLDDKDLDYKIKLNKDKNLNDLTGSERHLIEWFINDIGNNEEVTSHQLKNCCSLYSDANQYQKNSRKWYSLVKNEAKKYNFFDNSFSKVRSWFISGSVLVGVIEFVVLAIIEGLTGYPLSMGLAFTFGFFIASFIIYISTIDRRSKKGNEDFVRWKAFKNFLEDFSSFEDYPLPSLIVWEHYLVYATSFGIADKVSEQLKLKFDLATVASTDSTFIVYFGFHHRVGRFNRTVRNMRVTSNSVIASHNAATRSSSFGGRSGGGGFSGGSSFGGGGGSFGGGRR